uniref:Uncharacterized protein n=1 Tax=Arundo donax TaxID=35708 RepID=A0A0A9EIL9_ARUDO
MVGYLVKHRTCFLAQTLK